MRADRVSAVVVGVRLADRVGRMLGEFSAQAGGKIDICESGYGNSASFARAGGA